MRKFRKLLRVGLVLGALHASTSAMAQPDPVFSAVPYAQHGDLTLAFDVYRPNTDAVLPLVVWVHGGAWRFGTREDVPVLDLLDYGFAVASISFRLSPQAPYPAQVHDIKAAVRHLRANAAQFGVDPDRIAISGLSSGAHLAALVAVTNGSDAHEGTVGDHLQTSSDIQALVSYFGASNLTSILEQSTPFGLRVREPALELLFDGPPQERVAVAEAASPVFFVDRGDPPMYLLHGDQDPQMPIGQTHELHGAAKAAGVAVIFDVVHGGRHGGDAFFAPQRNAAVAAFLRGALIAP